MNTDKPMIDVELEALQRETFHYFLHETNPHNGLVRDKTATDWPSSISVLVETIKCGPVIGARDGFR